MNPLVHSPLTKLTTPLHRGRVQRLQAHAKNKLLESIPLALTVAVFLLGLAIISWKWQTAHIDTPEKASAGAGPETIAR